MPVAPTYPGVYVEEIPSDVRTITGVATSVAAFVDYFKRGLLNRPVQLLSLADFERELGGLDRRSEASYAIQQFFLNGGSEAWAVRTAGPPVAAADVQLLTGSGGAVALTVQAGRFDPALEPNATNPGRWGNDLRVTVDYPFPNPENRFNLTVSLLGVRDGRQVVVGSEVFLGLSMDAGDRSFVQKVVNDRFGGSRLVRVTASGAQPPLENGTRSGPLTPTLAITAATPQLRVTIGTEGTALVQLARRPGTLREARELLEAAIRAARPELRAFAEAAVTISGDRLRVVAGPAGAGTQVVFAAADPDPTATALALTPGASQSRSGVLSAPLGAGVLPHAGGQLQVQIGAGAPLTLTLPAMADLAAVRSTMEGAIRGLAGGLPPADQPSFAQARVATISEGGQDRLLVLAGVAGAAVSFTPQAPADTTTVIALGLGAAGATAVTALVSGALSPVPAVAPSSRVNLTIGGIGPATATTAANATTLGAVASELQAAIRAADGAPAFTGARVVPYSAGENRLLVLAGGAGGAVVFAQTPTDANSATELRLLAAGGAQMNVQSYALGAGPPIAGTAQGAGTPGDDGVPPGSQELIGSLAAKTGLHALEDVDLFNLLCLPRAAQVSGPQALSPTAAAAVIGAAANYCERRRAFLLVDTPTDVDDAQEVRDWLGANDTLRHKNAAFYFPRVEVADPLDNFRLRSIGASGVLAGLYSRIDATRGVWKAPAGTEATLSGVQRFPLVLTDGQNGTLNPLAINCLRVFPVYGNVAWGARTLVGADQMASEWKYVPVRRLALYLEESLYRGLKWVVFEPNDEPLWGQIRLNVGAFLQSLFRQGAFQGRTPREAYFVKCDRETTTPDDVNRGIVNILVGFAPLRPAEFVILQLQQMAAQTQA